MTKACFSAGKQETVEKRLKMQEREPVVGTRSQGSWKKTDQGYRTSVFCDEHIITDDITVMSSFEDLKEERMGITTDQI